MKDDICAKIRGKYPVGLTGAGGDVWKRQRTIVSPTFTAKKLKGVS